MIFALLLFLLPWTASNASIYVAHDDLHRHGLFSCFTTIIGLLDYYEKGDCDGVYIDYQDRGLYYEPLLGLNWWTYYFEPIHVARRDADLFVLDSALHGHFAMVTLNYLSMERIRYLIKKYIHVKSFIQKEIKRFKSKYFKNNFVIGVHYRGTDKIGEAPKVSYHTVYDRIAKAIKKFKPARYVIFLATDEKPMVDFLKSKFNDHVVCLDAIRSEDGKPTHYASKRNFLKGKEAVIDCLLLSEVQYLIRTSSNLSLCSTYFNPKLPVELINPGALDKRP